MNAFDPKTVKLAATYEAPGTFYALCLDETGKKLHGAGTEGVLYTVDLAAAKPTAEERWPLQECYVTSLILREGAFISSACQQMLTWSDAATGKAIHEVKAHKGWVRKAVLTPDGKHVVSIGDDMLVKVWNAETAAAVDTFTGHPLITPEGYTTAIYALAISPDSKHIATGDRPGNIRVWELATGKTVADFRAPEFYTYDPVKRSRSIGGIRGLAFSPDGTRLAVSGIGQVTNVDGFVGPCRIELWDWQAGKRVAAGQDKHQAILNHVVFGPQSPWLIGAGGGDSGGAIVFWDPATIAPAHVAKPKGHVQRFALATDGGRLYAAGHGGFQVWALKAES